MQVEVIDWNSNKILWDKHDADFILERDNWNDYLFYTYYYLHTRLIGDDNNYALIGGVRILKKGQKSNEFHLLSKGIIEKLGDNYCSLGTSIDYYERISKLEDDKKAKILDFLNDIIKKPSLVSRFKDEEGFNVSLMRNTNLNDDIFDLAPIILTGKYENLPDSKKLSFSFKSKDIQEPIVFDFSSKEYGFYNHLPNRICVLVGRNGSGKSTLLSKIARLVFSSAEDRAYIKDLGMLEPKGLGFSRIINISYSAFDSFQVPGITIAEKSKICEEMNENIGRYIYCGVRDIKKEVESEISNLETNTYGKIKLKYILNDRYEFNFLKSLTLLNDEFKFALEKILENNQKTDLLQESLLILSEEPSLNFLKSIKITVSDQNSIITFFNQLSTGHKFVIHSILKLIYHVEKRSLILFDEPESHLHPPLLAVLMKTLRFILEVQKSYMIIATHSPVVLQETLKKNIIIIRREGNTIKPIFPENQTFGENINSITTDVFGLSTDYTDYHEDLNKIVDTFTGSNDKFDDYLNSIFDNEISMQSYAYMTSRYLNSKK